MDKDLPAKPDPKVWLDKRRFMIESQEVFDSRVVLTNTLDLSRLGVLAVLVDAGQTRACGRFLCLIEQNDDADHHLIRVKITVPSQRARLRGRADDDL